jgi:G:T/U-mismatch repair DNA glycosylase
VENFAMLPEIWTPDLTVVFVGTSVAELSDTLGFYYLHPRNRFWELLVVGGVTPKRIITEQERKALTDGHKNGSLSDPVRTMFTQKKTDQLLRLGIGLTDLNRRVIASDDKDVAAKPSDDDVRAFITKAAMLKPKILAFVTDFDVFVEAFKNKYPGIREAPGPQAFKIADSEVWLLGSTSGRMRGEALARQEDAFFALGERIEGLTGEKAGG